MHTHIHDPFVGAAGKQVVIHSGYSSDTLSDLSFDINLQALTVEDEEQRGTKGTGLWGYSSSVYYYYNL